jgi:DNA-binding NarL/FixJ family response regulator
MRVVIADDEVLLREGLARLLAETGFEVVAKVGDPDQLLATIRHTHPQVAIVDIKMPPTHTDEGLVAAEEIRRLDPSVGVLVLSHYLESRYAMRLLQQHPEAVGYLLKERISDIAVLTDAIRRVAEGECVIDPTIVARLLARQRDSQDRGSPHQPDLLQARAPRRTRLPPPRPRRAHLPAHPMTHHATSKHGEESVSLDVKRAFPLRVYGRR